MEAEPELATFILESDGVALDYLESPTGVAASLLDQDSYSVRLKGGYYASGLTVSEAIQVLCAKDSQTHSHQPSQPEPPVAVNE